MNEVLNSTILKRSKAGKKLVWFLLYYDIISSGLAFVSAND